MVNTDAGQTTQRYPAQHLEPRLFKGWGIPGCQQLLILTFELKLKELFLICVPEARCCRELCQGHWWEVLYQMHLLGVEVPLHAVVFSEPLRYC